jgi:putative ABC transport system permease protein
LRNALRSLLTFGAMAVPFGIITSLVLGSIWQGAVVLAAALLGLILVGGTLAGIKWVALRLLPTGRFHLLRMARNNMRRRGLSMLFAMVALFIGTFTLGLAIVIVGGSQEQFELRMLSNEGYNLVVLSDPQQAQDAAAALAAQVEDATKDVGVRYETPLRAVSSGADEDLSDLPGALTLQGRDALWDVAVEGAPWGSVPGGVYLPADFGAAPEALRVTGMDGEALTLTVAGTYQMAGSWDRFLLPAPHGLLVEGATLLAFAGEDAYALAAAEVPPPALEEIAATVGADVPELMVVTANDLNDSFNATFKNLFTFAMLMAGLALVAGAVLIANAVSIAMIERRYEIGVLKAMGYSRGQVLRTILFEYGLVGTLAALLGILGVTLFVFVLTRLQEVMEGVVAVEPASALSILALTVGLTLIAALTAAWKPTSVRPLVVLNERA